MFGRRTTVIAVVALVLASGGVAVAQADGGSGASSVVIGAGQSGEWFQISQREGNDVVTVQNTFLAGGFSGWHSHPGITMVIVVSGEITLFREAVKGGKCRVQTYVAGDVFLERPGDEANAVNHGTVAAVVAATFFNVPHGTPPPTRIDRTAPLNCPVV